MLRTLLLLLLYASIAIAAEDGVDQKPLLFVSARTLLANQGKPTVNLVDLERYFVEQLRVRRFEYVYPSATTKASNPPAQNEYVLQLSVDDLHSAYRAARDRDGRSYEDPVFIIELSVTAIHLRTGRVLGNSFVPDVYHFSHDQMGDRVSKRAALYTSAERLAEVFASEVSEGALGEELRLSQRPLTLLEQIVAWHIVVEYLVIGILVIMILVFWLASNRRPKRAGKPRTVSYFGDYLKKSGVMYIEACGHSDEWYETVVNRSDKEILAKAPETPPEPRPALVPRPPQPQLPAPELRMPSPKLEVQLDRREQQLQQQFKTLDFNAPEGLLDELFYRPTRRLQKKVERAWLMGDFQAAMTRIAREQSNMADEHVRLEQSRQQHYLNSLITRRKAHEEYNSVQSDELTEARKQAIADAKAQAEIAKHTADAAEHQARAAVVLAVSEKKVRDAQREPLPPPPPPAQSPTQDEIRARNKQHIQADIERLKREEVEQVEKATCGRPENVWSEEQREEVVQIRNMYADAIAKRREELRRYL